jgi:RNA polymerase sigma-70 factor, ECF subfamily
MNDVDHLEHVWHQHRQRLLDIAYRMLGSVSDAEDVVQEAYTRLMRFDINRIDDVRGWLITVAGRLCLDHLKSADARRRAYVGPWLPEPLVELPDAGLDPADRVTLDDSVHMALLVVLEQLSPAERTAFVLHDVFQVSFDDVGTIVGRSPAACRQLATRARKRVQSDATPARFRVDASEQRRIAERFASACTAGDFEALLDILDPDVVIEFDSGGLLPPAAIRPLVGRDKVAAQVKWVFTTFDPNVTAASVNGEPGVVVTSQDHVVAVVAMSYRDGRIHQIRGVGNPEKLAHLGADTPRPRTDAD